MPQKIVTNSEFMDKLMNYSRNGALMQAFILQACELYSETVIKAYEAGTLNLGAGDFISPESWTACAREYLEETQKKVQNNCSV